MKEREEEKEAVRTTIVGGRPPGSGRSAAAVPRGIEVLVKKAAVDEAFRGKLMARRGAAAEEIGLELDPAEWAMLGVIAQEQLAGIIRQTLVPPEQRRVFMGHIAAAMLAVLGVGLASCHKSDATGADAGAPGPAPNPQSLPQSNPEIIKGLRATPAETSTQPAPAPPATGNTSPPNPPVVVFGLRLEPPPATSTQPASAPPQTTPAVDTQPRLLISAGILVLTSPATSTQPATGPGDVTPTQPPPPVLPIAGLMAPRPPATSTEPATDTKPAAPDNAPATTSTRRGYGTVPGGGGFGGAGPNQN